MISTGHPCPVMGCEVEYVPQGRLMCAQHWRQLPAGLRSEVQRTYQARLQAQVRLRAVSISAEAFAQAAERHREACRRAVAAAEGAWRA